LCFVEVDSGAARPHLLFDLLRYFRAGDFRLDFINNRIDLSGPSVRAAQALQTRAGFRQ
jgi:hypothetical protein